MEVPDRTDKAKAAGEAMADQEDDDEEGADESSGDAAGSGADGGAGNPDAAEDPVEKYRTLLSTLERDSQRSYDKAIPLSGGALGVTISFLKNVIHATTPEAMGVLFASWVCWGFSLASVLYSFYASNVALRKALSQLEDGTISEERPGGVYDYATAILNAASGLFFLAGTFLFVYFAYANMGEPPQHARTS